MTRWDPGDKRQILQSIADDERRPESERDAACRELAADQQQPAQPSRRRGRHGNVPPTQNDQDDDLLAAFNFHVNNGLTIGDYIELCRCFDQATNDCLDAFTHPLLLSIWKPNDAQLMIDLHGRTKSEDIRARCRDVIQHIAAYSPIELAKTKAQEFLQLNQETQ
jgi:hypothetical protein